MERQNFKKTKTLVTIAVTFLIFSFLFWEHFHGGVTSHHLLNQRDLPAISNWWSGLFLPVLTWFLLTRIEKRLLQYAPQESEISRHTRRVFWIFLTALGFGIILSISFTHDYKPFLDNVLYILLVLSFIIPIYYAEFILGFILGMTYTFGALLPTAFILVMAVLGILTYGLIRPTVLKLITRPGNSPANNPKR